MPASLEQDARAFLQARGAPATPGNMRSIMDFLSMNQDKRPSYGAEVAPPSTGSAIESRVDALVDGEAGNQNNAQQRALRKKHNISRGVAAVADQGMATAPVDQPGGSNDSGTAPGSESNTPNAAAEVAIPDPNNPDDPLAGTVNSPGVTNANPIDATIAKLLGPAAVAAGGAALAARGRAPRAPQAIRGVEALAAPTTKALPAPTSGATINIPPVSEAAPIRMQPAEPRLPAPPATYDTTAMSEAAVASGRANPIGHRRNTPLAESYNPESRLKQANRANRRKAKDTKNAARD